MKTTFDIRSVHLRVANLDRSVEFYTQLLGFVLLSDAVGRAELAAPGIGGEQSPAGHLLLTEHPRAPKAASQSAGLFHAALVLPTRAALGHWLRAAADAGVSFQGFSDHGVSEAIYLVDPDGNGLEFYADRPPEEWPRHHGELAMVTEPLALPALLAASAEETGPPLAGGRWGHLHLRVTDLDRSDAFYRANLGLHVTQQYGASARFLARDDYHHHLGINTWGGISRAHDPESLGLSEFTVAVEGVTTASTLIDPDGMAFQLIPV
jgi:catechol 2,3-dioxygenase